MFFLSKPALVSFPLSTLIANATTHLLYFTAGSGFCEAPLLAASANVAFLFSFFLGPFGVAVLNPFFLNDPFIASRFTTASLGRSSSRADPLSSDFVLLLLHEVSSSKPLRDDYFMPFFDFDYPSPYPPSPSSFVCRCILALTVGSLFKDSVGGNVPFPSF
jgi:hypothetical protein